MFISEIFYSLQGEGGLTGVPSVFVRTSGCNLRCAWCDTPYASWNPEGETRSVDEVVAAVQENSPARHVVLTGGEPMIARDIARVAERLKALGYHLTIETAGTIAPGGIPCDLVSLSPKLLNSAPDPRQHATWRRKHESTRWQPDVIRAWLEQYDYQFKFVVSRPEDVGEFEAMLAVLGQPIPRHKILLMPEAVSVERMRERAAWLGEICKARGYRYAHRLHLDLYGNKRGT